MPLSDIARQRNTVHYHYHSYLFNVDCTEEEALEFADTLADGAFESSNEDGTFTISADAKCKESLEHAYATFMKHKNIAKQAEEMWLYVLGTARLLRKYEDVIVVTDMQWLGEANEIHRNVLGKDLP